MNIWVWKNESSDSVGGRQEKLQEQVKGFSKSLKQKPLVDTRVPSPTPRYTTSIVETRERKNDKFPTNWHRAFYDDTETHAKITPTSIDREDSHVRPDGHFNRSEAAAGGGGAEMPGRNACVHTKLGVFVSSWAEVIVSQMCLSAHGFLNAGKKDVFKQEGCKWTLKWWLWIHSGI